MREGVLPFPKTFRPFLRNHARFLRHLITWYTSTRDLTRRALTHLGTTALERTTFIWIRNDSHLHRKLGYRLYTLPTSVQFSRTFFFAFRLSGQGNSREKHYRAVNRMSNFYFRYKQKTLLDFLIKVTLKPLLWAKNQNFSSEGIR